MIVGLADLIAYAVMLTLMFMLFYFDMRQYACDNLNCTFAQYAKEQSYDDRSKFVNYLNSMANRSVWMWAFYCAAFFSIFVVWWCAGTIIPFITFFGLFLILFLGFYFSMALFQHHFYNPIVREVVAYIQSSCSSNDQRPPLVGRKLGKNKSPPQLELQEESVPTL